MKNVKRFSIYWFDPNPVMGSEMQKIRPALVISPDEMNQTLRTVIVAPLTSANKPWPFRSTISIDGKESSIAFDQLKSADKSRLRSYMTSLDSTESAEALKTLQAIFAK